ncbi:hemagglutinin repeat-containing protein [[Enterobacter] lignolyticus]|uniref:Filamentous hemagglutinin family outer membrane protein n=1 Tax=Enterobacter lignolyticus (strain SCF1) TaxID=701347 RepID=E3G1H5_ENTLS|nr:hemagglutinin repeat-containing protein [[Enterobacter] lignolyticus]ADO50260.1 filamentous hemagglutinin family outer membrane protein [[Enterobacter] lignolyticus SCF1]
MNKLFYRIVFNKARGMLMVVADITRSHRAGVSPSSGADSKPGAALTATLTPLTFGILLCLAAITPAMAGIVADKSAPGNQQPQILNTASGLPQVNIQTPSAAGVSRNTYSQFDVDSKGAVLNNSHANTNTQLAGMVAGNPNLVKGEAKVILNEVNSRDPSRLNGYLEVAGQKAQVVIANPSGISCDGCGFINANRATLTTGRPQFSDGNLTGYQVNGGNITITGGGLDSKESDYTDIIARSVKVNAGIRANDLKVTTGRNQVDAAHATITKLADDGSQKPEMALDVSALGGMYAGKIRLTGTEQGVGVHNAGKIGATAGNVVLTADGRIENSGLVSSAADTQITSRSDIVNSGKLHSNGQLTLSSDGNLSHSGTLVSGGSLTATAKTLTSTKDSLIAAGVDDGGRLTKPGDITLTTTGPLEAHGQTLAGGNIQAAGDGIDISGSQTAAQSVVLEARSGPLSTAGATVDAQKGLTAHTTSAFNNDGGALTADKLTLSSRDLSNRSGTITQLGEDDLTLNPAGNLDNQGGKIRSNSNNLTLSANTLNNTSGEITHAGKGKLSLAAQQAVDNRSGTIQTAGDMAATSETFNNAGGTLAGTGTFSLQTASLNNTLGNIGTGGDMQLLLNEGLDNRQGKIASSGRLGIKTTDVLNQSGILGAGGLFTLNANNLINQAGVIKAGDNLQFSLSDTLDNSASGVMGADGDMQLKAQTLLNDQGKLLTNGSARIVALAVGNRAGQIAVQSVLDLQADTLKNDTGGQLQSGDDMMLAVKSLSNTGTVDQGGISARGSLTITSSSVDNTSGLLLAGKSLSLLNTLLANQHGQIVAQGAADISTVSDLDNQNGIVQGNGITLNTQGHALNNQHGTLYSLAALTVNSADLNNQGGTLGAGTDATVTANALDNRNGGRIVAQGNARLSAQSLQNQQGQIQSAGDLWLNIVSRLNNQNGLLRSGATTTLAAQQLDNSATQGNNQGIEGQTVNITSGTFNNQSGSLLANDGMTLNVAGQLDNRSGLMSAGNTFTMDGRALQLTNTGGTASAGSLLALNALSLTGDGQLLSSGDMAITSQQGMSNWGKLIANNNLSLTTGGNITNSGQLLAGNILNIHGNSLTNLQAGEINGGTDRLYFSGSITNYGLIDGGLTWLETGTLANTGTGRIYGDSIGVNVATFNNLAAGGVAPVLAGRQQVNIGAQTLNNDGHALIYSDGTLAVGGALAADGTVIGRAGVINNHSATMESAGDMVLNVSQLNNINDHFSTELVTVSVIDKLVYQWRGTMYDTADYNIHLDKDETWIICIEGVTCHSTNKGDNFNEYRYTETTQETQVKESDPAKLLAGGHLTINGNTVTNDNSEIVAGGTLAVNATTVNNVQAEGQRIITDKGTLKHYWRDSQKGGDKPGIDTSKYTPPTIIQTISLSPGRMGENSSFSGSGENIDAQGNRNTDVKTGGAGSTDTGVNGSGRAPVAPRPGARFDVVPVNGDDGTVIRTVMPDTRLPDNSLFNVITDNNSSYLIQTDPRFTNNRRWLASDYMQDKLGLDQTMKRLGDGYYEQRLVREQIIALSGMRYLDGFSSDEDEYQALMDNGLAFNDQYHLTPGVALTAEQMAKLTKPIVWLVNTTIAMPDGSRQTVLVPQVYAPVKPGDLNASGALMSGGNIAMHLAGDLNNSGVIGGRKATVITAENILNNAGTLQGADVSLNARNDITSIGGSLLGLDSLVANAGRDINLTTTTRSSTSSNATSQFSRTSLDKVASITVLNDNSTLVINAGRDANLTAAQVVNAGNDSQTLIAAGRNVNLNTVTTASQDDVAWDKDNTLHQANSHETGTRIAGSGSVSVAAGQDINARAVSVNAGDALNLAAGHDISIVSGTDHNDVDERHKKTGTSGMLSSTTTTTRDAFSRDTAQASQLSGNTVSINGGHDVLIKGSDVAGTQDVTLHGGHDVTITAADERNQETHVKQQTTSGLTGTGGIGVSYGTQDLKVTDTLSENTHRGSTVGSSDGNLSVSAGNNLAAINSDLIAGRDVLLKGKNVSILAAQDESTATHKVEQKTSGLTLALSGAAGSALNTAVTTAKQSQDESNSRIAALQATKAALSGVQAGQAVALDQAQGADPKNDNAIGVTLSYGSQSSKSEQTQTSTTSRGSSVTAGHNLNIQASDGDISVQGSQLQAGNNAVLDASRDIILKSGENTSALTGKNESKGGTAGIGIGAGSGGWGIQISASVNSASGKESGSGLTHTESTLTAGNTVTMKSGRDTLMTGAQVSGDSVKVKVGRDLIMTSEQDSDNYDSKQQSASAGGSFNIGSMTGSANISLSQDKMHSNWKSVQEQTGIQAGQGGFDITVGNHTQLNGATIASTAPGDKNSLDTGTLGWRDIHNQADYKVEHAGVGLSTGGSIGSQFAGNAANGLLSGLNGSGHDEGTTHAAIGEGTVTLRNKDSQTQNIADLSRDTAGANGSIGQIFDKEKEQDRIRETQLISEIGTQAGDIATTQGALQGLKAQKDPQKLAEARAQLEREGKPFTDADVAQQAYNNAMAQWGTGSAVQMGIQGATAALSGLANGNLAGAIAGASAPVLADIIGHHAGIDNNTEAKAIAHAVLGGVVAELNGGSALAGAAGAASGELAAGAIAKVLYPDIDTKNLSQSQKDTVTALATVAAGMVGGIMGGDTSGAMSGAQAGKNAVENNLLGTEIDQAKAAQAHGADVLSCNDAPGGEACKRGEAVNKAYAGALATGSVALLPGGAQAMWGLGAGANAGINYLTEGTIDPTTAIIGGWVNVISAGNGVVGTVGWNAAGGALGNWLEGKDPTSGALINGAGSFVGYGIGNGIKWGVNTGANWWKGGWDPKFNADLRQFTEVKGEYGLSKEMIPSKLPSSFGDISSSFSSEYGGKKFEPFIEDKLK